MPAAAVRSVVCDRLQASQATTRPVQNVQLFYRNVLQVSLQGKTVKAAKKLKKSSLSRFLGYLKLILFFIYE